MTCVDPPRGRLLSRHAKVAPLVAGDQCDRYQLVHQVAQGGMANVWLARLRSKHGFERLVALKTILPAFADDPKFRRMFLDEARIASRINHAHVAPIFDLGECNGNLYLVMEWIDGDSLANLARAAEAHPGKFPLPLVLKVLADACAGLHAAHELRDEGGRALDVVHRDVSPHNILVSATGIVKVIDFGVAKARVRMAEETSIGTVKGKLHYLAPERALGMPADRRADVWSVGAVLYRVLAGRPTYRGPDERSILDQLVSGVLPDVLPPGFPNSVQRLVSKALAPNPRDRFATAADLQRALEAAIHGLGVTVTARDIADFMAARLGESLTLRRFAVSTALESIDQSLTLRAARPATSEGDRIFFEPRLESTLPPARVTVQALPTPFGPARSTAPSTPPRTTFVEVFRSALQALGAVSFGVVGVAVLHWALFSAAEPVRLQPAPPIAALASNWATPVAHRAPALPPPPCAASSYVKVADLALEGRAHSVETGPPKKAKQKRWHPRPWAAPGPALQRQPERPALPQTSAPLLAQASTSHSTRAKKRIVIDDGF